MMRDAKPSDCQPELFVNLRRSLFMLSAVATATGTEVDYGSMNVVGPKNKPFTDEDQRRLEAAEARRQRRRVKRLAHRGKTRG